MPIPPYAQLQVQRNGGAFQAPGLVAVTAADVITLTPASTVNVTQWLWEILDYPVGFSTPTGWTRDSVTGVIYVQGTPTPPTFTIPAQGPNNWGKFALRLRVNGNPLQYNSAGLINTGFNPQLTDSSTILKFLDPNGLEGFAVQESTQGDTVGAIIRAWAGAIMRNLRAISIAITGNSALAGEAYIVAGDAITMSLPSIGTPTLVPLAHGGTTLLNTTFAGSGIQTTVPGPVKISGHICFTAPTGPTKVLFQIYQNAVAIAEGLSPAQYTAGQLVVVPVQCLATAAASDVFQLYAYTSGAGGATSVPISNATLVVNSAGARQGPQGVQGPQGPPGSSTGIIDLGVITPNSTGGTFKVPVQHGKSSVCTNTQLAVGGSLNQSTITIVIDTNPSTSASTDQIQVKDSGYFWDKSQVTVVSAVSDLIQNPYTKKIESSFIILNQPGDAFTWQRILGDPTYGNYWGIV